MPRALAADLDGSRLAILDGPAAHRSRTPHMLTRSLFNPGHNASLREQGGTPGRSRTCGLPLRKGPLYPAELRGRGVASLLGPPDELQRRGPEGRRNRLGSPFFTHS